MKDTESNSRPFQISCFRITVSVSCMYYTEDQRIKKSFFYVIVKCSSTTSSQVLTIYYSEAYSVAKLETTSCFLSWSLLHSCVGPAYPICIQYRISEQIKVELISFRGTSPRLFMQSRGEYANRRCGAGNECGIRMFGMPYCTVRTSWLCTKEHTSLGTTQNKQTRKLALWLVQDQ